MVRLWLILGVAAALFWVFSVVDSALSERAAVRGVPKPVWILLTLLLPIIGGLMWFAIGRPRRRGGAARRTIAPDDDADFLGGGRSPRREWTAEETERLRRLEEELGNNGSDPSGRRDG